MTRWGLLGGAFLAAAAADPALAANCATVSFSPGSLSVPAWNPFTTSPQQATFTMTLTRVSTATTGIRIIFTDTNDSSQPVKLGTNSVGSGPPYQVLDPSGNNIVYPLGTTIDSVKPTPLVQYQNKNSNNTVSVSLRLYAPGNTANADYGSGTYSETPNYIIQCTNGGNNNNPVDGPFSGPAVSMQIPNQVSLTTASAATIDFQNFTTSTAQVSIGVKSTGPVNVAMTSLNGMTMGRSGANSPYPLNSRIDYTATFNGKSISTSNPLLNQTRAGVGGMSWPLMLTLTGGVPSGKVAGSYSDTITLTLAPGS